MGRRRPRAHAPRALHRPRTSALPKTPGDDRAGVRTHEVQPWHRSLPTPRTIRRTLGMAANHRHPQPAEAPQAPDRGRWGLKGPRDRPVGPIRLTAAKTTTPVRARNPPRTPTLTDAGTFAKQPRRKAGVSNERAGSPHETTAFVLCARQRRERSDARSVR